jgi:hypothetical protein
MQEVPFCFLFFVLALSHRSCRRFPFVFCLLFWLFLIDHAGGSLLFFVFCFGSFSSIMQPEEVFSLLFVVFYFGSFSLRLRVAGAGGAVASTAPRVDLNAPQIREALFFPDKSDSAFEKFYTYLRSATKTIDIAVYTMSDNRVEQLLEDAHKAGVKVCAVSCFVFAVLIVCLQIRIVTDNEVRTCRFFFFFCLCR